MKICLNGKFVSAADAKISVFDTGFTSGYGIYETLRAEKGVILNLDKHVDRLFRSAGLVDLKLPWSKVLVKRWTQETLKRNGLNGAARMRITVTFGSDAAYSPKKFGPQIVIFAVSAKKAAAKKAYKVVTYEIERILPEAKTTNLLPQYIARQEMVRKKADEVLLVNRRGEITEGSVTNVFFVRGRTLFTPRKGILHGTARARVIQAAKKLGFRVFERSVKISELKNFNECFVTNAPTGVVPVLSIDKRKISGKIGRVTNQIRQYVCKKN